MAKKLNAEDTNYTQAQAQIELLEALLEADDSLYPWNTADPESEAYFAAREQDLLLDDWFEKMESPQTFLTQLDQIWCATTPPADAEAGGTRGPLWGDRGPHGVEPGPCGGFPR